MKTFIRRTVTAAAVLAATTIAGLGAFQADADTLHHKDGRVLEGEVVKKTDTYVIFKHDREEIVLTSDILKLVTEEDEKPAKDPEKTGGERDADKPAKDDQPVNRAGATAPGSNNARKASSGATRVAFLNFGLPSAYREDVGDTVGIQVANRAFEDVIPMLEKAEVDVVIVRINSGGGLLAELAPFHQTFQEEYKPKFRTVGWVESAISAAAMSPYVLEEFYFLPEGNLGACTGWRGALQAMNGMPLEQVFVMMEEASRQGNRSPYIMRSMQVMDPLSATVDEVTGQVTWSQDLSGEHVVNPNNRVLTLNAYDAERFRFSKGTAATREELMRAMGIEEYEFVAQDATDYIDNYTRRADRVDKRFGEAVQKYAMSLRAAQGARDRRDLQTECGIALRLLKQMKRWVDMNPNFQFMYAGAFGGRLLDREWYEIENQRIRDLLAQ